MGECKLQILTDKEVEDSITSIDLWIATHSQSGVHICAEDLAVAVPGECMFLELMQENDDATRENEKGILVYTNEREEQYLWLRGDWHPLERILKISSPKDGWVQTQTLGERLLVLILTQLDYRARESEGEVPYGCCPPTDPTYLLWVDHRPAGMASIKRKGGSIWGGEEVYACDTLDTLYVRPCYRRQGYTMALLGTLSASLPPGDHLGLSHPISLSMCKVLLKFIQVYPDLRETLWTLDEDGEVSGTVMLMLGSLMMRGVIYPSLAQSPASPQAPTLSSATLSPLAVVSTTATLVPHLQQKLTLHSCATNLNNTLSSVKLGVSAPPVTTPNCSDDRAQQTTSYCSSNLQTMNDCCSVEDFCEAMTHQHGSGCSDEAVTSLETSIDCSEMAASPAQDKEEPCDTS